MSDKRAVWDGRCRTIATPHASIAAGARRETLGITKAGRTVRAIAALTFAKLEHPVLAAVRHGPVKQA